MSAVRLLSSDKWTWLTSRRRQTTPNAGSRATRSEDKRLRFYGTGMSGAQISNEYATSLQFGWATTPRASAINLAADLVALSDWPRPAARGELSRNVFVRRRSLVDPSRRQPGAQSMVRFRGTEYYVAAAMS